MWALGTLDAGFFADSSDPFVVAGRRVSVPTCSSVLKSTRKHIPTSLKQRSKQGNFGAFRGCLCHGWHSSETYVVGMRLPILRGERVSYKWIGCSSVLVEIFMVTTLWGSLSDDSFDVRRSLMRKGKSSYTMPLPALNSSAHGTRTSVPFMRRQDRMVVSISATCTGASFIILKIRKPMRNDVVCGRPCLPKERRITRPFVLLATVRMGEVFLFEVRRLLSISSCQR